LNFGVGLGSQPLFLVFWRESQPKKSVTVNSSNVCRIMLIKPFIVDELSFYFERTNEVFYYYCFGVWNQGESVGIAGEKVNAPPAELKYKEP
jgi:hypothetical protein